MNIRAESTANILLVDDDPLTLGAFEALLHGPGRSIVKAESGEEALRCLLREDFALILLDVRMPGLDGLETAALIRQRERSRYTPIIFLSAADTLHSDTLKGVSSGGVDYLFKPVVPEVLKTKVSVFVDLFHANERLKQQAVRLSEERFRCRRIGRRRLRGGLSRSIGFLRDESPGDHAGNGDQRKDRCREHQPTQ